MFTVNYSLEDCVLKCSRYNETVMVKEMVWGLRLAFKGEVRVGFSLWLGI